MSFLSDAGCKGQRRRSSKKTQSTLHWKRQVQNYYIIQSAYYKKSHSESSIDYIIRDENTATTLNDVDETVSDLLLVAIMRKAIPDDYTPFVAVITQQEKIQDFQNLNRI